MGPFLRPVEGSARPRHERCAYSCRLRSFPASSGVKPPRSIGRDEVYPLRVVRHAPGRHMLVGADADMIDPRRSRPSPFRPSMYLSRLGKKCQMPIEPAGLGNRPRMVEADLPAGQPGLGPHRLRPEESCVRQQQRVSSRLLIAWFTMSSVCVRATSQTKPSR